LDIAMTLAPLLAAPAVIQIHVAAALLALTGGIVVALMPKGTARHRQIGYIFTIGMLVTAISSVWIGRSGHFSWIHLLTVLTLVQLPYAIIMRRRGNITAHKKAMTGLFIGLAIAGAFTLLPGRIMHAAVFGGI
jgi:uncharacterized membrane protein